MVARPSLPQQAARLRWRDGFQAVHVIAGEVSTSFFDRSPPAHRADGPELAQGAVHAPYVAIWCDSAYRYNSGRCRWALHPGPARWTVSSQGRQPRWPSNLMFLKPSVRRLDRASPACRLYAEQCYQYPCRGLSAQTPTRLHTPIKKPSNSAYGGTECRPVSRSSTACARATPRCRLRTGLMFLQLAAPAQALRRTIWLTSPGRATPGPCARL